MAVVPKHTGQKGLLFETIFKWLVRVKIPTEILPTTTKVAYTNFTRIFLKIVCENVETGRCGQFLTDSVRPKRPFCVSAETETFRPVAEPKHRNVSAEPKQSSNVTIPPKSEYFIKHFTTNLIFTLC